MKSINRIILAAGLCAALGGCFTGPDDMYRDRHGYYPSGSHYNQRYHDHRNWHDRDYDDDEYYNSW